MLWELTEKLPRCPDQKVRLDFPLLAPKQFLTARVIFWRPVNPDEFAEDIAGLELETPAPNDARPAQWVKSDNLWEHRFRVLGFPDGKPNGVWASGRLCGKLANGWVQLEGVKQEGYRLEPGFSGAPIWDEELQGVAGMAVANETRRPETRAAFFIPANVLIEAWPELGEQAIPPCSPIPVTPEQFLRSKIYQSIKQPGALICVKTSQQTDIIYLIAKKIISEETPKDYQAVSVNFKLANRDVFTSPEKLLQWFCRQVSSELNLQNTVAEFWQGGIPGNIKCTKYFEKYLLPEIKTTLVVVLYNVELILTHQAIADNFFGLLRSWHESYANEDSWKKLRFVIVHSQDIITNPPLNVAVFIDFPDPAGGQ
ncbi:MAG: AAA-like domain-containing protein [Microcoleus sp.]